MANTYTTGLRLSKPGLGDAGWGTTVNGGLTDLVDQAVVGSVNVAVTSGGTTTLPAISDGASSDARNMSLAITGSLTTGQTATVRVPATVAGITKLYSVANGAGGTVTVETSGGTSVAVPDGARMLLRVTSAGVSEAVNYVASLTLGTALPATSGGTGHSSYTVGDLLYASSTTALTKLTVGATGAVLTVAAGIPAWTPTISVSSGGTGAASLAANNVLLGNGTSALQVVAPGTSGNVLASNGTTWVSTAIGTLVPAATDTVSGVVELATNAEVQTGTDTTRAITPASLRAGFNATGTAPVYACRAWVNFNGTTGTIRSSGNVTSVTRNGAGDYTINFTTALQDANYAVTGTASGNSSHPQLALATAWNVAPTASALRIYTGRTGGSGSLGSTDDAEYVSVAVFR